MATELVSRFRGEPEAEMLTMIGMRRSGLCAGTGERRRGRRKERWRSGNGVRRDRVVD